MIVTRLKCDGCMAEAPWYRSEMLSGPTGWLIIGQEDRDAVHVCSFACLLVWANRERPVEAGSLPVRVGDGERYRWPGNGDFKAKT